MHALTLLAGTVAAACVIAASPGHAARYAYTQLYTFTGGADGDSPFGGVIYHGGALFGTTGYGGSGAGVVFAVNASTGAETVLHSFTGPDGANPGAGVIYQGGNLYGTTVQGGKSGHGVVYRVNPTTDAYTLIHDFRQGKDGVRPDGELTYVGGILYGTTVEGGAYQRGTVFAIDLATRTETVLYSFAKTDDGSSPGAGVIYQDGILYGTTDGGDGGTVFALNIATGTETKLHQFGAAPDGSQPNQVIYQGGMLYGTTNRGGTAGLGTIFEVDPVSGAETILYNFVRKEDGEYPQAPLIYHGNEFYGTTVFGGHEHGGTAFRFNASSGAYKPIYMFGSPNSITPLAPLLYHAGSFYGTLANNIYGAVYRLTP